MDIILKYFTEFTSTQLQQLGALNSLYKEWNEKINVISRKDIDSLYERHVLHSLSIAAVFPFEKNIQVLDLGCGGGFPGIPLAIFFPDTHFYMVDSIAKKLKVVEEVADVIGLKNITTRHCRVEDIKDKKFDFVISRAVAPLKDLWKWSRPLIQKTISKEAAEKGRHAPGLICLKGGNLAVEIQESGTKPYITPIKEIFNEPFFEEKYILYVPK